MIGHTRKQLFHARRSFNYDENAEMVDAHKQRMWQIAEMINYREPQILELLKNTELAQLYMVLFPIENLHVVVDMAKRIFTKEN